MIIVQHWRKIIDWLLPQYCLFCKNPATKFHLCGACQTDLPWLGTACCRCGSPLSQANLNCGECSNHPPEYDSTIALFSYQPPIDHLVLGLKFRQKLVYAQVLGELMAEKIAQHCLTKKPEYLIPIPLHPSRMQKRGYNQALEIARPIAKKLNIPLEVISARRILATKPQAEIPADKRQQNVSQAFQVNPQFRAKHIALIDDVVTTGSTINALAKCYRKIGVQQIDIWCCVKTTKNT